MEELIRITQKEDGSRVVSLDERFDFNGHTLDLYRNKHHDVLFVARQICNVLELSNTGMALAGLDEDEKLTSTLLMSGQNREAAFITESGFYSLVLRSKKSEAKSFKKWVTSVVLPKIRKTGSFVPEKQIDQFAFMQMQLDMMKAQSQRIDAVEDKMKLIEAKTVTSPTEYYAIAGYASLVHFPIDVKIAAELGRKATSLCNQLGYVTGTIPDPRFGRVKTYPFEVLKSVFDSHLTTIKQ